MFDVKDDDLAGRFEGVWRIDRHIDDNANALTGRFVGHARLWRSLDGLTYHETGDLVMGAATALKAERKFIWQTQHAATIDVFFDDGRYFHSFNPGKPVSVAEHDCSPDRYVVNYEFGLPNRWKSSWEVSGPRKNYRMTSVFSR